MKKLSEWNFLPKKYEENEDDLTPFTSWLGGSYLGKSELAEVRNVARLKNCHSNRARVVRS